MPDTARETYTETLGRLDERIKSVETRMSQPMRCVEGAIIAAKLEHMSETLKDIVAVREEDYRQLSGHDKRIASLEETRVRQISEHEDRLKSLENKSAGVTARVVAIVTAVAVVVSAAISSLCDFWR